MTHEHRGWSTRLHDYLDGSLDWTQRAEVEAHLESCPQCAEELRELEDMRARARALPREIAPSRDLWAGIAARIEGMSVPAAPPVIEIQRRRRPLIPWGWLAAAAVILMVVSSGATALLLRGGRGDSPAPLALSPETETRPVGLAAFASAEVEYQQAVATLEAELSARRDRLQPETIAAVEQNLAIIDAAIAEARAALAADPSSADLPLLLSGVYLHKVDLLRKALDLTART